MQIINIDDPKLIEKTIGVLKRGGLIIYPTETCYGVGVDATNPEAIRKALKYKMKPEGKSISIAVSSKNMASRYVEINKTAENLYNQFLPGPVTVISKSKNILSKLLESENGNLGVRIPSYKILLDIIEKLDKPITATSANLARKKIPYSIEDVLNNISNKQRDLIDLMIDAGELPHNPSSTVIDTTSEELTVYRSGRIDPREFKLYEAKITNSKEETIQFAENIIKNLTNSPNRYIAILLNGELGAGKTHFVKGIAKGLGINQLVKSPTYNYVNEYKIDTGDKRQEDKNEEEVEGAGSQLPVTNYQELGTRNNTKTLEQINEQTPAKLIHFDAWRIQSKEDLEALGFYKWFKDNNIVVIEWPTVISNLDQDFFEKLESYFYIDFIKLDEERREIRIYKKFNSSTAE